MQKIGRSVALSLVLALSLCGVVFGQGSPEGTFAVTAVGSEVGTIAFTLVLKKAADKWSGEIVDSPLPLTIKTVTVDPDNKVTIVAGTGDAEVTIIGKYDGTKIAGDWSSGEAKGTWTAARKEAAKTASVGAPTAVPAAALDALAGTYDAEVTADGQGSLPFTLVLTKTGDKLVPEIKNADALGATSFEVSADGVKLNATFQGNPFSLPGKVTGTSMGGKWEAGGLTGSWTAKKKAN